jgi:predicted Zn-dependent peptidase
MLDAVLTAGRGSKLQAELMQGRQSVLQIDENLGWPSASPADFKDPGYYAAILIHKTNFKAAEIVDQYQQVIDGIAATGIDGTELRRVKVVLRLGKATGLQTALERARLLGTLELMDGDPGLADRDYAAFQAVTAEQVQAAVRKYLTAARRDVMTITPAPASPAPVAHGAVQ